MKMNLSSLRDRAAWEQAGVKLPQYDVAAVAEKTKAAPIWVHFGAGNIFRGFVAVLQQKLLNAGLSDRGIVAVDSFDFDIIDKIYAAHDNLTMNVTLHADASMSCELIASVVEAIKADASDAAQMQRLAQVFAQPALQIVSFTITEKGYALHRADGSLLPVVEADIRNDPQKADHVMSIVTAGMLRRFQGGAHPVALVSMDNCSHNGERLQNSIMTIARAWAENGFADQGFLDYLSDAAKVGFPWSMIDKITPRPDAKVEAVLLAKGIEDMAPIVTSKNTFIAPFVNAERPEYLVIEDAFPNGRPALEKAGVYLTDRDTVNKTERMKVTTCLNPLHTAMSLYGCLLGYTLISKEMHDQEVVALIRRLGYQEGLPVVTDPGILSPQAFIDEVVNERLPNPFMPDAPQRIATDTSQKVSIRFGETIKSYLAEGRDLDELVAVPLAIAGWFRYLLAVDDQGQAMDISADPLKEELQAALAGVRWNDPASYHGQLKGMLANPAIFGLDINQTKLAGRIEAYFVEELAGIGAVRNTLRHHLAAR